MLWLRRCGVIEKGPPIISIFDFTREFERQIYFENAEDESKDHLWRLKHLGLIHEYIKDFTILILEILNLFDKDVFFNFMDGLQLWANIDQRWCGVQDLATTIIVAKSLIDYYTKESTSKPKDKKSSQAKVGGR